MADLYSLFDDISTARVEEAAACFIQVDRPAGDLLAEEGASQAALQFIEIGEVSVHAGGFEVARMEAGSMIGEIGLFTHAVRTATVRAETDVRLQSLDRAAFVKLRNSGNPVAFRIERRAIDQLGARLRQLVDEVVEVGRKVPSLVIPPRKNFEYGGHPMPLPPSRLLSALRASRAFAGAPEGALSYIADKLEARTYNAGETLAADGRDDGPMYMLAHGQIDCLAPVGMSGQVRLATLDPGEVFNLIQHVDEKPRPVAYVARDGVSVLALRKEPVRQMLFANTFEGSVLRIAMIRSLSDRVNQANATFSLGKLLAPET